MSAILDVRNMELVADSDHVKEVGPTQRTVVRAREQVEEGIRKYGSIDQWPVLSLTPDQFPLCKCGHLRVRHNTVGNECGYVRCKCDFFVAKGIGHGD